MATERWAKPGEKQRMSELQTAIWTPKRREDQRKSSLAIAARPDVVERHAAAVGSAEARARVSKQMQERWATDHQYRALMTATARAYHSDPENKRKFSEQMRRLWADPIHRMKRRNLRSTANAARSLLKVIDAAVPKYLPDAMRADVCQDVMVALLEGTASISAIDSAVRDRIGAYRRMYPDLGAPLSLDAPAYRGGNSPPLIDTIASDAEHF